MCGLVGVAGDLTARDNDVFRELLYVDALRGFHSTGAAFVNGNTKKVTLIKKPGSPMQILPLKAFSDANNSWQTNVCIGHNRLATVGEHTEENAHPFSFKHIVGAHNGTLEMRARKILVDNEKFGTDSEALYHNLNEFDPETVMAEMSGAWALTWYDRRDHSLNFLRNNQRPLHYAFNEAGDVIYWASESAMLRWVLDRNHIKHGAIYELNPDVWASFTVAGRKTRFGDPELREVKGWKPAPFVPAQRGTYEHLPWVDGQSEEDAFTGWSPHGTPNFLLTGPEMIGPGTRAHERGSPVMDRESSKAKPGNKQPSQSNNGRSQRKTDVLPGLPQSKKASEATPLPIVVTKPSGVPLTKAEQANMERSLQKAWGDGFVAGDRGQSKSQCPFPAGSKHHDQWMQGRLAGLECYKSEKRTSSDSIALRRIANFREGDDTERRVKGYNGEMITKDEFEKRTGNECRWGSCTVEFEDQVQWLGRDDCVCHSCVTGNKLVRELLGAA